ncbi:glycosyl transferase protein [Rutstroemia sp. NJR-2017a BBW]|nr:glycosyl transferase protein [Rutstroemia sp. NJR-2017a BBW]
MVLSILVILWSLSFFFVPPQSSIISSIFPTNSANRHDVIQNIVHYVWIVRNPSAELKLGFELFLTIYSSHLYLRPDVIYLHTDVTPEIVERAKHSSDHWTRLILNLPILKVNHVSTPTHTATGKEIRSLEHKGDFVRGEILNAMGGVYLDLGALPIRDIRPLRATGFANIVGANSAGMYNSGVMLSKKGSALSTIMRKEMHRVFDGSEGTHSTILLTSIANRLSAVPKEVLVLGQNAFRSIGENVEEAKTLFQPHPETDTTSMNNYRLAPHCQDVWKWWESRAEKLADWVTDYSSSYILISSGRPQVESWDGEITLEYVLERRSNFALLAYPAVAHAIKAGYLDTVVPFFEAD